VGLPSATGRSIDWKASLEPLTDVLTRTEDRTLQAQYVVQRPELTTAEARALGIREVVSEFTTGSFAQDSGVNIRRVAEEVDGAIVAPGETFSLNGYTGHRGAAQGYVEAGIIKNGRPARGIGGGISQFATTLFNASYFAGMTDIEHHEHSYYISRYPEGREATVFEGVLDVKFRNDSPSGILIDTSWTPESITVRFWSTKHYDVESITSDRSEFTDPPTKRISGDPCIETSGSPGFTVSNTRVVRDADTGAVVSRNSHTTVYDPVPRVICE
jgi:vancomycin resistance protein YoaR